MVSKHLTVEEHPVTDTVTPRPLSESSDSLLRFAIRAESRTGSVPVTRS